LQKEPPLPRWPRLVWTGLAVAAYALLVGFQPSVTRAALIALTISPPTDVGRKLLKKTPISVRFQQSVS